MNTSLTQIFNLLLIVLVINFAVHTPKALAIDEIIFFGGEPLDRYQPSAIVPILKEAFKRNGIKFNAVYHPSLRSLVLSNSGATDGELHRVYDFHKASGDKYPNLIRIESQLLSGWTSAFSNKKIEIKKLK